MRWTLLTALVAAGAAGADEIEAERERDDTATGRERAARARAALPTAEAKADAWQQAVVEDAAAQPTVAAVGHAASAACTTRSCCAPYVETLPRRLLDTSWAARTHDIAESIVERLLPAAAGRRRALADATQALAGRAPRRPGRPAPAGGREPRRRRARARRPGAGRRPRLTGATTRQDPPSLAARGVLSRPAAGAVSAGRPCGPAGGPSARPSGPRAAAGVPSGPASGSRQFGYSSSVPGWLMVRRSPTASASGHPDQPGRGPGQEPVQRLDHVALGAAGPQQPALAQHRQHGLLLGGVDLALLLHGAGQQPELARAGRCAHRRGSRPSAAGRAW